MRYVQEDFKPTQRLVCLEILAKPMKGFKSPKADVGYLIADLVEYQIGNQNPTIPLRLPRRQGDSLDLSLSFLMEKSRSQHSSQKSMAKTKTPQVRLDKLRTFQILLANSVDENIAFLLHNMLDRIFLMAS